MLWDSDLPIQEYTDTHVYTTIYDQGSFVPIARLAWLRDDLPKVANDDIESLDNESNAIQVYHYHNDQLGTPNELTNEKGEVVWLADYEAWGNTAKLVWNEQVIGQIQVSQNELQPIRFQGQHFDEETGLSYNRFRYYDPDMGMFTTRDPIQLQGGFNVFQYAPNSVNWIDPFGLDYSMAGLGAITGQSAASMNYMASNPPSRVPNNSRVNKFIKDIGYNISKGGNVEAEAGGTLVAVLGVRQTFGATKDSQGRTCPTVTTCALIGPMIGAYSHAGGSVTTGTLTPGSRTWSLSRTGTGTIGTGAGLGGAVGADGSITGSLEGTAGAAGGAAAMICSKKVSTQCTK
ncbi:RHS repeat-associated core domain-containing protein [Psychrobacter sp. HII-4]|uniref:RHS repeat-associated core domain-containing protein n=2 Tax=unclassified Psychrobacter TaxID=196806 RepID=UPI001917D953|nr:RHS repeat-associated core domain-containing protein [Psychrobacter sp. HII-4]